VDDVSPFWLEKLAEIGSPKLKSGRVNVVKLEGGKISDDSKRENRFFSAAMPYIEHYEDRFNALNSVLFAREFAFASIEDGVDFGLRLNELLKSPKEWFVLHSANARMADGFAAQMGRYVLNPGTLHYLDLSTRGDTKYVANADVETTGYAALFSKNAISLREFGFDRIAHARSFADILAMWQPDKIVELSSAIDKAAAAPRLEGGKRYAIWGTGSAGSAAACAIRGCGARLTLAADRDANKHGADFYGTPIEAPESIRSRMGDFDYLIVANYTRFAEMKREALDFGVAGSRVLLMSDI
jgi:hypothetical protein